MTYDLWEESHNHESQKKYHIKEHSKIKTQKRFEIMELNCNAHRSSHLIHKPAPV